MSLSWLVAELAAGAWLLVALLQVGDIATVFFDWRTARDRDEPGRIARERTNELFWVIPLGAVVALAIGVGIDYVGRYFFQLDNLALGTLFLLGLAVLVVGIGALTLAATVATDSVSYSALRRDMREYEGERITPQQLTEYKARLARIDARARSRIRPKPQRITTPRMLRLASILVGLLLIASIAVAQAASPSARTAFLVWVAILAPVLNALFAGLAIRFSISSDAAWRRVYARQRLDILKLLDGFEKVTRKKVAGLGDRVARALKILGEQQS